MKRILHFITAMATILALSVSASAGSAGRHDKPEHNGRHHHKEAKAPKHNNKHMHSWHQDTRHDKHMRPAPQPQHRQTPKHMPRHNPMPAPRHRPAPYRRPTPPPRFRPSYNLVDGILGLTLGSAINISMNYLNANGYNIGSHSGNTIGLTNVMEMNMMWPIANLYYSASGLTASEFMYYSHDPSTKRYKKLYKGLRSRYGEPASVNRHNNGMISASWFGYGNQFVTLTYQPAADPYGMPSFLTSLTIGN